MTWPPLSAPRLSLIVSAFLLSAPAATSSAQAPTSRVLYLSASAGDGPPQSDPCPRRHRLSRTDDRFVHAQASEDVALLNPTTLAGYDAVIFFTSGELPLADGQKAALLDFVASGKGSSVSTAPPTRSTPGLNMARCSVDTWSAHPGSGSRPPSTSAVAAWEHPATGHWAPAFTWTRRALPVSRLVERQPECPALSRSRGRCRRSDRVTTTSMPCRGRGVMARATSSTRRSGTTWPDGRRGLPPARARRHQVGARRRRRRRSAGRLGDGLWARSLFTPVLRGRLGRSRCRRPHQPPGAAGRHAPSRILQALSRRRRVHRLLRHAAGAVERRVDTPPAWRFASCSRVALQSPTSKRFRHSSAHADAAGPPSLTANRSVHRPRVGRADRARPHDVVGRHRLRLARGVGGDGPSTTWFFAEGSTAGRFLALLPAAEPEPDAPDGDDPVFPAGRRHPPGRRGSLHAGAPSRTTLDVRGQGRSSRRRRAAAITARSPSSQSARCIAPARTDVCRRPWSRPARRRRTRAGPLPKAPRDRSSISSSCSRTRRPRIAIGRLPAVRGREWPVADLRGAGECRRTMWIDEQAVPGLGIRPLDNRRLSTRSPRPTACRSSPSGHVVAEPGGSAGSGPKPTAHSGAHRDRTRWALAEGEIGGPQHADTFILIANTSATAGEARVNSTSRMARRACSSSIWGTAGRRSMWARRSRKPQGAASRWSSRLARPSTFAHRKWWLSE